MELHTAIYNSRNPTRPWLQTWCAKSNALAPGGEAAVSVLQRAEDFLRGGGMQGLLWTPLYVARKRG